MPINIKDSIESSTIKGSLNGNASTATKATQDSAGQQINTTYIKGLSVNGRTITYTKGDGTTGSITTQDTNTTYSTGTTSTSGLTKLYTGTGTATDGTMTQAAINSALGGKANSSHTHSSLTGVAGSNIAPSTGTGVMRYDYNVSSSVAGTLPVTNNANGVLTLNTHSGNYYNQLGFSSNGNLYYRAFNGVALDTTTAWKQIAFTNSSITGNAATATTLQTARTINGTSFNGSANITTANWGTARTLTIGKTGKSVNGSGNVSWSTSEILGQGTITTGDWNSANTMGVYEVSEFSGSNGPTGAYKWGGLLTLRHGNVTNQVYLSHSNNEMWIRGGWNGTWNSSWSRVYTSTHPQTTITGNAGTATKLQTPRTINGTSFDGSANITTANWGTARTITVGNTGKSVNGSGNVSWSLSEIGALPLTGGTLSGRLTANGRISAPTSGSSWINGMTITNATIGISTQQATGSYHPVLAVKTSGNHVANIGGIGDDFGFYGFKSGRTENGTDWSFKINVGTGAVSSTGNITAPTFVGALSGNASTATTLQTARTINGTSFNGSANITTANWGTARTLIIGNSGKSVNGSGNVSWSLSEIGAAPTSHNHTSLTGVTNIAFAAGSSDTASMGVTVSSDTTYFDFNLTDDANTDMWRWRFGAWDSSTSSTKTFNAMTLTATSPTAAKLTVPGTVQASTFSGALSGNATTATTLQTARTINGTSFNGSANITTANWGASRTLTIGNSSKSVNGSGNVSWSLSEIGAAAASHTHNQINSRGNVTAESGVTGRPAVSGLSMSEVYSNGYPTPYGNVISLKGMGDGQILVGWSGTDGAHAPVYVRSKRDNTSTANWSPWAELYTTANYAPAPHWGTGNPSNSDGRPNGTVYYKYA